jgi:ABC-type proline/glycine betaine transport system ATPase subunit
MKHILNAPILFVTHDRREAMVLADQLIVMVDGEIRQCGKPLDIYHHPIDNDVKDLVCEESYD